ncbi:hypothetical protein F5J12DRAFT_927940 [Pisolithus orientalis]|uniref:uncharacterized protein n=1 Tax=Pisolithus orientalis TaxID=936130 RepID=UPI002223F8F9|nr:uncharacterized protein F5J12DRAFT_927940 [Pisolithus orientalis]KAI6004523.1 hypothetical protein F5J12DRAFT_927940 [Pisolithus orientalis]
MTNPDLRVSRVLTKLIIRDALKQLRRTTTARDRGRWITQLLDCQHPPELHTKSSATPSEPYIHGPKVSSCTGLGRYLYDCNVVGIKISVMLTAVTTAASGAMFLEKYPKKLCLRRMETDCYPINGLNDESKNGNNHDDARGPVGVSLATISPKRTVRINGEALENRSRVLVYGVSFRPSVRQRNGINGTADTHTINFTIPRRIEILYHDSGLQMRTPGRVYPCDYPTYWDTCAGWHRGQRVCQEYMRAVGILTSDFGGYSPGQPPFGCRPAEWTGLVLMRIVYKTSVGFS